MVVCGCVECTAGTRLWCLRHLGGLDAAGCPLLNCLSAVLELWREAWAERPREFNLVVNVCIRRVSTLMVCLLHGSLLLVKGVEAGMHGKNRKCHGPQLAMWTSTWSAPSGTPFPLCIQHACCQCCCFLEW